ncbi:alpha-(1,3)-fucosyltransferase 10 isoform X1 [Hylaeus volcanicus]|uniref:alpha-(1,3)-fucosyltransferase 10 isoform X1 n=1 Tax=Hylaeus volcanicus TaxID=313075 RepID=UPI0023B8445C|nr:alpha-(1,3)-fucosyltransferase 10 isoform X1 [Hylaeus volcanicus]
MLYFNQKVYFVFVTIIIFAASIIIYQMSLIQFDNKLHNLGEEVPVILWWTPFGNDGILRKCGDYSCYFTSNRTFQYHPKISSFLFYGSNFQINNLPKWKSDRVPWGLIHEESPRNNPILVQQETLNLFTYSSTFSRFSDVPLTLIYLPGITELLGTYNVLKLLLRNSTFLHYIFSIWIPYEDTIKIINWLRNNKYFWSTNLFIFYYLEINISDKKYFIPTKKKTELMHTKNLAPLLYIQSDCDTASNRDVYVAELMKYIRVDSYGTCLNNAQFDKRLKDNYLDILNSDDFLSFISNYKFTLAFENAVCQDYITEKLWRPLIVGSVPVYYGSPTFKDWLPNNMSAISILDFKDPESLANFLHDLSTNETEYDKYLSHKLFDNYEIDNQRLKKALESNREWIGNEFGNYVDKFECFVCENIQIANEQRKKKIIDTSHYDCPLPRNPITSRTDYHNWWTKQWILEKFGAKLLTYHLKNNLTISVEKFEKDKMELYRQNQD